MKNDKERITNFNERGLPVEIIWESEYLAQKITYRYNDDSVLIEEKVQQLEKQTHHLKIMLVEYYEKTCKTIIIDGNTIEIIESGI
ncbi:hypothetical protein [Scytonema sp. NUACC26]|uniref:hypothetical protein n=1 Tax=Scytonema sp. NUACC26 TaxID=3140176 RepID=UPI0034DB8C36